jgi:outer membrane protein OmpA-like peptidoglycan-associated protein
MHDRSISSLTRLAGTLAIGALLVAAPAAHAQIGGMLRGAVNDQVQRKIDNAVSCAFTDQACINKAKADGKSVKVTDAKGKKLSSADSAKAMNGGADSSATTATATTAASVGGAAESVPPGKGAWLNYDFIPGDSVLFADDFANDKVGDLPTHEDVSEGNVTIVDINGTKYLRTVTGGTMTINLPENLPQRFTLEVTFHRKGGNGMGMTLHLGDQTNTDNQLQLRCDQAVATIYGHGPNGAKSSGESVPGVGADDFEVCRLMVDSGYAKAYVNNVRIGQLNGLVFPRTNVIGVDLPNADDNGSLITNIRIAAGGKPMYDALIANGRVSTHGILFATNSATIEGESTPTLTEIGQMLKAHPELKLTIEGHTDNTGVAAHNQTLSEQRAAAVAQYLKSQFQVDASRLTTKGFGDTKPVASNTTPEGRQQNRRVDLVKM